MLSTVFLMQKQWLTWWWCVPQHNKYTGKCFLWILSIEVNDYLINYTAISTPTTPTHFPASLLKIFPILLSFSRFWKADSFLPFQHLKRCQTPHKKSHMFWAKVNFDNPCNIPWYQNQSSCWTVSRHSLYNFKRAKL